MIATAASRKWATEPIENRFWNLQDLRSNLAGRKDFERKATVGELQVIGDGQKIFLKGPKGQAEVGNWAFSQMSKLAKAPAKYLETLPAELAARNINHGLAEYEKKNAGLKLLLNNDPEEGWNVRAMMSLRYARIPNLSVIDAVSPLLGAGWRTPPARPAMGGDPRTRPATSEDCLKCVVPGLSVRPGDLIAPAGVYCSETSMFAFLINEERPIAGNLFRGFILENSEVGKRKLRLSMFLLNAVCGNHIIHGFQSVAEFEFLHVGDAAERAKQALDVDLRKYADQPASIEEGVIGKTRRLVLGKDKEEVVGSLASFFKGRVGDEFIESGYDQAVQHPEDHDGDPHTAWGMLQGLTRASQVMKNQELRYDMDRQIGSILSMAN